MSPIALSPTEIAFFDFNGLVRTADFLRAAQHKLQHEPSTDFVPFSDGTGTELKLSLDIVSRNDLGNVVREEQNLHKFQVFLLKPSAVPNSGSSTVRGNRYGPQASPSVTVFNTEVDTPGHL